MCAHGLSRALDSSYNHTVCTPAQCVSRALVLYCLCLGKRHYIGQQNFVRCEVTKRAQCSGGLAVRGECSLSSIGLPHLYD